MSEARPMQPQGPDRDRQMWAARLRLADESEAARLEAERRRELATIVGRIAAQSPRHASRRRGARTASTARRRGRR
jgi:hypothetical protein